MRIRLCSIGINRFNRNQVWLKWLRFPIEHCFNRSWLTRGCDWAWSFPNSAFSAKVCKTTEAQLVASVVLQELLEELVPPHCESDDELDIYWKRRGHLPLVLQATLRMSSLISC